MKNFKSIIGAAVIILAVTLTTFGKTGTISTTKTGTISTTKIGTISTTQTGTISTTQIEILYTLDKLPWFELLLTTLQVY